MISGLRGPAAARDSRRAEMGVYPKEEEGPALTWRVNADASEPARSRIGISATTNRTRCGKASPSRRSPRRAHVAYIFIRVRIPPAGENSRSRRSGSLRAQRFSDSRGSSDPVSNLNATCIRGAGAYICGGKNRIDRTLRRQARLARETKPPFPRIAGRVRAAPGRSSTTVETLALVPTSSKKAGVG